MATWHTVESIKKDWRDATDLDDEQLADLLAIAQDECEDYAPAEDVKDPANIPDRVRLAQLMHAQAIWRSRNVKGQDGTIDLSGQTVTVYPMDWQVKNHLRPARGFPGIG